MLAHFLLSRDSVFIHAVSVVVIVVVVQVGPLLQIVNHVRIKFTLVIIFPDVCYVPSETLRRDHSSNDTNDGQDDNNGGTNNKINDCNSKNNK